MKRARAPIPGCADEVRDDAADAASAGPPPRSALERITRSRWLPVVTTPVLVVLAVLAWKVYVEASDISEFVLPPPEDVARAFWGQITEGYVWRRHIWTTFYEAMLGLALAIGVGVPLGFAVGKSVIFEKVTRPFVVGSQVVPKVALVPLFILWFGFGPASKVVISAMLAFFPLLTNTAFGVRSVPKGMREMFESLGASRWKRFWKLDFHYTLAYILTGMEVAVVLATIGAIVGEYLGGDRGLGRYVVNLQRQLQIPELFGAIIIMTLFGFLLYSAVNVVRRLVIPWHESVQVHRRDVS